MLFGEDFLEGGGHEVCCYLTDVSSGLIQSNRVGHDLGEIVLEGIYPPEEKKLES